MTVEGGERVGEYGRLKVTCRDGEEYVEDDREENLKEHEGGRRRKGVKQRKERVWMRK